METIHWNPFISAVPWFLAYITSCAVTAFSQGGVPRSDLGSCFGSVGIWGTQEPDGKPRLLQGPHPGDLVHHRPHSCRGAGGGGQVSTKGVESSAKRSGSWYLELVTQRGSLCPPPHSDLSALAWDWERKGIASCGLSVTVRGVRSGLQLFYFALCWSVIIVILRSTDTLINLCARVLVCS